MAKFAIVYRPGAGWKAGRPWSEQALYAHGTYMQSLFDKGQLVYGGPFDDHTGGLAVVEVDDASAAQRVIDEDPAVIEGVFDAEHHPWVTVFDQPEGTSSFRTRD